MWLRKQRPRSVNDESLRKDNKPTRARKWRDGLFQFATTMSATEHPLTEWQLTEGLRRKEVVLSYYHLIESEPALSLRKSAQRLGVSCSKLRVILKTYEETQDFRSLIPKISDGRPSVAEQLVKEVGPEQFQRTIELVKGHVLDTQTNSGSWRFVASTQPVPEPIKSVVLSSEKASKHNIPKSLTVLTKVSRANQLAHRGQRALRLHGSSVPVDLSDVLPGDIFVPDDTTPIWGWWVPWEKSREYPYGKKILQGQFLEMIDYASVYRLGFSMIARERSSYRASDIFAFFGDVFDSIGLPRLGLQLEGGIWQSNLIRGHKVKGQAAIDPERPFNCAITLPDEPTIERRLGALSMLPANVLAYHRQIANKPLPNTLTMWRSVLPKTKPIEMAFRLQQPLEGILWGGLGRDQRRVANEKNQKLFEACRRGAADPGLHFLSWTEIAERMGKIIEYLNQDPMEGPKRRGRPAEEWMKALKEHGGLYSLPTDLQWMYRSHSVVREIRGAFVDCSYKSPITGKTVKLHYSNPKAFAELDGRRVVVFFDTDNPERPAEVVSESNQWLCQAEHWNGTGAFIAGNEDGFKISNQYFSAVMRLTKIIAQRSPSQQLPPEIEARRKAHAGELCSGRGFANSRPRSSESSRAMPLASLVNYGEPEQVEPERPSSCSRALAPDELIHFEAEKISPPDRESGGEQGVKQQRIAPTSKETE